MLISYNSHTPNATTTSTATTTKVMGVAGLKGLPVHAGVPCCGLVQTVSEDGVPFGQVPNLTTLLAVDILFSIHVTHSMSIILS